MHKILILAALFLPLTSFAAFDTNLTYGSHGQNVIELQEFLTDQGVYSGPISGNFYSLTRTAVKAYQTKQNISPASGFWGPLTRAQAQKVLDAGNTDEATQSVSETGTTSTPVSPSKPKTVQTVQLAPESINQITNLLGSAKPTMPDPIIFDLFTGIVTESNGQLSFGVVANQPVATLTGDNIASWSEIPNGDTVYRNTKNPAWTYKVVIKDGDNTAPFLMTVVDSNGDSISKTISL